MLKSWINYFDVLLKVRSVISVHLIRVSVDKSSAIPLEFASAGQ